MRSRSKSSRSAVSIESLVLSSFRGGYKVGIIEGAEALNANGANAFLKTLEEPTGDTLLIMIAKPSHRLPATVASRCLRLPLHPPAKPAALGWLEERRPGVHNWDAALALAGGAPLQALELQAAGITALEEEMQASSAIERGRGRCHAAGGALGKVRSNLAADLA